MEGGVLYVQMLGKFSVYYGGEPVVFKRMGKAKSVRLLQMLLLAGRKGIPKNELLDSLYSWNEQEDAADRNRNLNNLAYRLRRQLIAAGLPQEDEYVTIREGLCFWNSGLRLEFDVEQFEQAARQAEARSGEERVSALEKANESYFGELLPMNMAEPWFYERSLYYKELYVRTIRLLEEEYRKNRSFGECRRLYSRAAALYPYDGWQREEIRCCLETGFYDEAARIYREMVELYSGAVGAFSPEWLRKCFEIPESKRENGAESGFEEQVGGEEEFEIKERAVAEDIFGRPAEGAYYCIYPSFIDSCRLIMEIKKRANFGIALLFLSIRRYRRRGKGEGECLKEQMELLKQVIGKNLRGSDAYTRYGSNSFILMLVMAGVPDCARVFQRIERAFNRARGSRGELRYYTVYLEDLRQRAKGGL